MCLENEKLLPDNNKIINGYAVIEKIKKNRYKSLIELYSFVPSYLINKEYIAIIDRPLFSNNGYYGFHGFTNLKTAKKYYIRQKNWYNIMGWSNINLVIVKCQFRNIIAKGNQENSQLPAFRAKYRTIIEEVNI